MRRLSIVIPHAGDHDRLETTLLSVLENRPESSEILVVLSSIYNDPYGLADGEVSFIYAPIGTDPIRCLNLGMDASQAPVVHLLTPGMVVVPGWSEAAMARLDRDPEVMAVSPIVYDLDDPQTVLGRGIEYRIGGAIHNVTQESTPVLGPSRHVGFYRKSVVEMLDQFDVTLGEAVADADLALKIDAVGGRTAVEPMCRVFFDRSMERYLAGVADVRAAEQLFWRWAYRKGWIRSLISHLGQAVFDTVTLFPRPSLLSSMFGRLIGLASVGNRRSMAKRLDMVARRIRKESAELGVSERRAA